MPRSSPTTTKSTTGRKTVKRRQVRRRRVKLLTAFRYLDPNQELHTGFVRTLNLSTVGALLESPDEFKVGEPLSVEFLLDNNCIAPAEARVTRVTPRDQFYHIAIEFTRLSARARRLIEKQISA